ncbi:hypothetical protein H7I76_09215, partial [Mycolicibacterium vaccae]|nr:hypothetical protein [Mycolicibacterium vaccae]
DDVRAVGKSPYPDHGQDGYSVAWVDTDAGRFQVLVDGARPAPAPPVG